MEVNLIELYIELVQLIFSIGLVVSLAFLPLILLSAQETQWRHNDAIEGTICLLPSRLLLPAYFQRWTARTVRRKEAPDDDTDYSLLVGCLTTNREDLYENNKTFTYDHTRSDAAPNAWRMLIGSPACTN